MPKECCKEATGPPKREFNKRVKASCSAMKR